MLFEKVQHTGDCGLTGRFADNRTSLKLNSVLEAMKNVKDFTDVAGAFGIKVK